MAAYYYLLKTIIKEDDSMDNSVILIVLEVLLGFALILVLLFNKNILFNCEEETKNSKEPTFKEKK